MNLDNLLLLVIACLAVNLSPGPSVLLVTSVSAARGFTAGLFAALGMAAGAFVYVVLAACGVAALIATSPMAFSAIQTLGAAYLIYLGIDLLRNRPTAAVTIDNKAAHISWHYFKRGFLVDLLNPKIVLFFFAFIPQFLNSVATPGFGISMALGSVFLVTGAIVNGSIAWLVAAGSKRASGKVGQLVQRWIPGGVLIFLGLRLLWQEN